MNCFKEEKHPKDRYVKVVSAIACNELADSVDQRSDCTFCAV